MEGFETKNDATAAWVSLLVMIIVVLVVSLHETQTHTHNDTGKAVWKATGDE